MTHQTRPPLRADAERNRELIVDAACELFAEQGLDVPLEDVARRAGVGIATLYRRFPTRADLAAAAFGRRISAYVEVVDRALGAADPWDGVCTLVYGACELQAADAGLRELLTMTFPDTPEAGRLADDAQARLQALLDRARRAGVIRDDVGTEDIALILLGNAGIVTATHQHAGEAWRRFAALALEAIRRREDPAPLPPAPSPQAMRRVFEN